MTKLIETFSDGTTTERDLTEQELAQIEADKLTEAERIARLEAKAQAKEVAQAKLSALGLTVEDLEALGL
jgi:hypothetical protein